MTGLHNGLPSSIHALSRASGCFATSNPAQWMSLKGRLESLTNQAVSGRPVFSRDWLGLLIREVLWRGATVLLSHVDTSSTAYRTRWSRPRANWYDMPLSKRRPSIRGQGRGATRGIRYDLENRFAGALVVQRRQPYLAVRAERRRRAGPGGETGTRRPQGPRDSPADDHLFGA